MFSGLSRVHWTSGAPSSDSWVRFDNFDQSMIHFFFMQTGVEGCNRSSRLLNIYCKYTNCIKTLFIVHLNKSKIETVKIITINLLDLFFLIVQCSHSWLRSEFESNFHRHGRGPGHEGIFRDAQKSDKVR